MVRLQTTSTQATQVKYFAIQVSNQAFDDFLTTHTNNSLKLCLTSIDDYGTLKKNASKNLK